ncbi:TetR/AcrR family transcriptional regulator [Neobacillus bataviensis LMG 21833]|uniref:TetR/AcrR family transcriptional regulator n=1 Tax=Neobacillus bataviensis LMG 21833 TaxID=1117379 RepID=K6DGZ9_9BACI|nr:TetR/AcrR family transcriptional regulator [Neobacillus bataviensis]EKN67559.1 TetR/AcrR family transcriptional regulator [Neobacillus bataviensis LMG 21833]
MNDRKQHVVDAARQLFIDKGYQATSIQDILNYSGISKGTFYNYFSSKNELLIALFKMIYKKLDYDRNELLIGEDPSNVEIFIKQVELQLKMTRTNKLLFLFEEVFVSHDEELKQFIRGGQLRSLRWVYNRFIDLFGESKKPYLLDCAVMFIGILLHNLKFNGMAKRSNTTSIEKIVRYSMERIKHMVTEVSKADEQLLNPEVLDQWLPNCQKYSQFFQQELYHTILLLKKSLNQNGDQFKNMELLDFIHDELLNNKKPRKYLIESALSSLNSKKDITEEINFQKLNHLVASFFKEIEEKS